MRRRLVYGGILLAIIVVGAFYFVNYNILLKERKNLESNLERLTKSVRKLEREKVGLKVKLAEEMKLKAKGKPIEMNMETLKAELENTQEELLSTKLKIETLNKNLGDLKDKNLLLQKEKSSLLKKSSSLENQIQRLTKEKLAIRVKLNSLQAKLNSLNGLKKAIRELKHKSLEAKIFKLKERDARELAGGNRGYVIKDGKSTTPHKVKIEVLPAP